MSSTLLPVIARPRTFGSDFDPRSNSFGFLRLLLAAAVLYSHTFTLGGYGAEPLLEFSGGLFSLGTLSVTGFFSISGFLILRSSAQSSDVVAFLWHRFLRIFPGFWLCLLVTVVGFVPLYCALEHRDLSTFVHDSRSDLIGYLTGAPWLDIRQADIPPLLASNPLPGAINGSLWTLIYEWKCYLLAAGGGLLLWFRGGKWLVVGGCVLIWAFGMAHQQHWPAKFSSLPRWFRDPQMSFLAAYFAVGGAYYIMRATIPNRLSLFIVTVSALVFGLKTKTMGYVGPPAFAYAVLWLAINLPKKFSVFDQIGDVSYGLYIYGFPVQQALVAARFTMDPKVQSFSCLT